MARLVEWGATLWRRLHFYLRRAEFERELAEEMRFHLEMKAEQLRRDGVPAADARSAAARQFGNVTLHRENAREVLTMGWVETLAQDLRYAVRSLRRSPGFTLVAVLSLAIGIGATTAIFTLVNVTLLKPLPFAAQERLAALYDALTPGVMTASDTVPFSYPRYALLRRSVPAFEDAAAFAWDDMILSADDGGASAEQLRVEQVSASYFPTLGVTALLGRTFLAAEDSSGGDPAVVLLSHGLWKRRFGADPAAVGRAVTLKGRPFTVVGVLPPDFAGLTGGDVDAWVPLHSRLLFGGRDAAMVTSASAMWLRMIARIRPGVSPDVVRAQLAAVPGDGRISFTGRKGTWVTGALPLAEARRHPMLEPLLTLLSTVAAAVLLIVCANLAGLLLARAQARRGELGVRMALGAGRGRLARQALTESGVLAAAGGVAGTALAYWLAAALVRLRPELPPTFTLLRSTDLLRSASLAPDWRVLLFALAATVAAGLLFGAAPALAAARADAGEVLKGGAGRWGTARAPARRALVVVEVALATTLLVGAGLMLRSFREVLRTDLGFEPRGVVALDVSWTDTALSASSARRAALLERIAALPLVEAVGQANCTPLGGGCTMMMAERVDGVAVERSGVPPLEQHVVSPDYLRALRIPLVAGRAFAAGDAGAGSPPVLVNETAARLFWPGTSAVGRRLVAGDAGRRDSSGAEVIGVVRDVPYGALEEPPAPAIYLLDTPAHRRTRTLTLVVRARGTAAARDPAALVPALRRALAEAEPGVATSAVRTMPEAVSKAVSSTRFVTALLALFAAVAAFLAALGVYGVLAYMVTQRWREFGVRMALGAEPARVLRLVVRQGAGLTALGVAAGCAAALAGTAALQRFLYGVGRTDALTFGAVALLVGLTGLLAAYVPARRAMRADPASALRGE